MPTTAHPSLQHMECIKFLCAEFDRLREEMKPTPPPVGQAEGDIIAFLRDLHVNYDCDGQGGRHPASCRSCRAEALFKRLTAAQPLEKIEELPPPAEEFRAGLPPEALREVCAWWIDDEGDRVIFSGAEYRFERWPNRSEWQEHRSSEWDRLRLRPAASTRAEVETLAAQRLGEQDAKAGKRPRLDKELFAALGDQLDAGTLPLMAAYRVAYEAAKKEDS
jgi:hypothetical protein